MSIIIMFLLLQITSPETLQPFCERLLMPPDNVDTVEITNAFVKEYFAKRGTNDLLAFYKDLNNDGSPELFVVNVHYPMGNGGTNFYIFDNKNRKCIGSMDAGAIYIRKTINHEYPIIETAWHMSSDETGVGRYYYKNGKYVQRKHFYIKGEKAKIYFTIQKQ